MTEETAIDRAHARMMAAPDDDAARLAFYDHVANTELFLMLAREAEADVVDPEVFSLDEGQVVLAFDREDRLAAFAGRTVPFAALSGRALAGMLAPARIGLGLNLEVAPSSILIPTDALAWLADTLAETPEDTEASIEELTPPSGLPERVLEALDRKLASAPGLAETACLVGVTYAGGGQGHLLAFLDAVPGAEDALAKAIGEALTFSGVEAGSIDVGFFSSSDPMVERMSRVGLQFDLPKPPDPETAPAAPGMDPERPPRLR